MCIFSHGNLQNIGVLGSGKASATALRIGFEEKHRTYGNKMGSEQKHEEDKVGYCIGSEEIGRMSKEGKLKEALDALTLMEEKGIGIDSGAYVSLLKGCTEMKNLPGGRRVHTHIRKSGIQLDTLLGNSLLNMYAKCGSLEDARQFFDKMSERDAVSWSIIIAAYVQCGEGQEALGLVSQMQQAGFKPTQSMFASVLKVCAALADVKKGQNVHSYIVKIGLCSDVYTGSALVTMYSKCGYIEDARKVFDEVTSPNVVLWSAMIAGYAQNEQGGNALEIFHQMQLAGLKPNKYTFASVVTACGSLEALEKGKWVHALIVKSSLESEVPVAKNDRFVLRGVAAL